MGTKSKATGTNHDDAAPLDSSKHEEGAHGTIEFAPPSYASSKNWSLWILLIGLFLHCLFSAEGMEYVQSLGDPTKAKYPISGVIGYASAGIFLSLVFVPAFHNSLPEPRPNSYQLKHVVWAIYVGLAMRISSNVFVNFVLTDKI